MQFQSSLRRCFDCNRDLETGEVATYKVYKSAGKYLRLTTGVGDMYFRVEPISKREFEEAKNGHRGIDIRPSTG